VSQIIGSSTSSKYAATHGAVTVSGSGHATVTLNPTASPTVSTTGANTQGAVSGSGMTSPLSSLYVIGTNAVSKLSLTGGAGADTLLGCTVADTITGGAGNDSLTGGADGDTFVFRVGDSNPVLSGSAGTSDGQDILTENFTSGIGVGFLQFNITSADQTWTISNHVQVGTNDGAGANVETTAVAGTVTIGDTDSFTAATVLVQTGVGVAASADNTDAFDIAIRMGTALTQAEALAITKVNLTGTALADTLTTGANNDTIAGGSGNDVITGAGGADSIDGGAGNDTYVLAAQTDSEVATASATNKRSAGIDVVSVTSGDKFDITGVTAVLDAAAGGVAIAVSLSGSTEITGTTFLAALNTAITAAVGAGTVAAAEAFLVNVTDTSTDTSFDGGWGGYYLVIANDATVDGSDYIVEIVGATSIAAASGDIGFGG
jgi:Ca2+-binding RTX toxin-like protein